MGLENGLQVLASADFFSGSVLLDPSTILDAYVPMNTVALVCSLKYPCTVEAMPTYAGQTVLLTRNKLVCCVNTASYYIGREKLVTQLFR